MPLWFLVLIQDDKELLKTNTSVTDLKPPPPPPKKKECLGFNL